MDGSENLYMVPLNFPVCEVNPHKVQKGGRATVEARGLTPNRMAKVVLGDDMVATGSIDSTGHTTIDFIVPTDAVEGIRLLTTGVVGAGLTADCSLEILGLQQQPTSAPTLSEWGIVIMGLILAATGTFFIFHRHLTASPLTAGNTQFTERADQPLLSLKGFGKVLVRAVAVVLPGLLILALLDISISILDICGTLLCVLIVAYIVHLLSSAAKQHPLNRS
jgi:uncharacterized membrane protein YczE